MPIRFNTVNGKYCCNNALQKTNTSVELLGFNTVNGKYCCNNKNTDVNYDIREGFNTVNGKYCCNKKALDVAKQAEVSIP